MPSGNSFVTDFINLRDITAAGGATFNAGANSSDLGNNTGWAFTGSTYTLSLAYNYACINPTGSTEVQVVVDGPASNFWWQKTIAPYDTFNTNIDTVMATGQSKYVFVQEYGTNCTLEDTVFINVRANANGIAQTYQNNVGDEAWDNCSNWDNGLVVHGSIYNYGVFNSTAGDVIISGNGQDSLSGSDTVTVNSLEINKTGHISFANVLKVTGYAEFIKGIFYTTNTGFIHFASGSDNNKGADSSFVDGPVSYTGSDAFSFPVGDSTIWAPLRITEPLTTGNVSTWRGQYFFETPIDTASSNLSSPIIKISGVEYWQIDKLAGTGSVRVSLSWKDNVRSGISNHSLMRVMKHNGTSWQDYGRSGSGGTAPSGWLRSNYVTNFSPFTFGTTNNINFLPVEFLSVDAQWAELDALVTWETASELNNSHFEIERSTNGIDYINVGKVESQNPNSQSKLAYSFYDKNAFNIKPDLIYYRIKQIDFDGQFSYSRVVILRKDKRLKLALYPNPSKGQITVSGGEGELFILDLFGKQVYQDVMDTDTKIMDLSHLRHGTYVLKLESSIGVSTRRFILN